jgi:hypothetical protein
MRKLANGSQSRSLTMTGRSMNWSRTTEHFLPGLGCSSLQGARVVAKGKDPWSFTNYRLSTDRVDHGISHGNIFDQSRSPGSRRPWDQDWILTLEFHESIVSLRWLLCHVDLLLNLFDNRKKTLHSDVFFVIWAELISRFSVLNDKIFISF